MSKGGPLQFPGNVGGLPRRAPFLNGELKTYFGQGQLPNCFADSLSGYVKPAQWPASGTLLRIPQQVLLTSNVALIFGLYLHGVFDLIGIYIQVKNTIESLRRNRTWVDIMDWNYKWTFNPLLTNGFVHPPVNNNPDVNAVYSLGNRFSYMLAPNPADVFLGTDFLHIYCGAGYSPSPLLASDTPETAYDVLPQFSGYTNQSGEIYQLNKQWLTQSYSRFTGYNASMYSINSGSTLSDPNYLTLANEFQAICEDMSAFGYRYGGGYTNVTVENLVKLIAANYNFDPSTGRDL